MTDDIVAFIRARLDEDASIAEEASRRWLKTKIYDKVRPPNVREVHIARHDPASVLRGVEAKRLLLEFHQPFDAEGRTWCGHCGFPSDFAHPSADVDPWPCRHARLLASEWSTHPDYQQEWSV